MIKNKINLCLPVLLLLLLVSACKSNPDYREVAGERAVAAAKALVATDHNNPIKMEQMILDAKAVQSEYLLMGDTVAAQAFDAAFREYLVMHDELLAKELFE